MSLKQKTGAEQEARLARQEVEGLTQARDWLVFLWRFTVIHRIRQIPKKQAYLRISNLLLLYNNY